MINKNYIKALCLILFIFASCNKDDVIEKETSQKPVITLDSETGVYATKIGKTLTIAPSVEYNDNAIYSWIIDGKLVSTEPTYSATWTTEGEIYITFRVETLTGTAEEELRVDVSNLAPPVISLVLPSQGLKVLSGTDYVFTPDIQNQDEDNFECQWIRNGEVVATGITYTFNESQLGSYPITIKTTNVDGEATKEITVEVVETMPYKASFETPSYLQTSTDRNTFVGRPVFLNPTLEYFDNPQYAWSVDGEAIENETSSIYKFTPTTAGNYTVKVNVTENLITKSALTRNITRAATSISTEVVVHCLDSEQMDNFRFSTTSSSQIQNKVYEYTPAPGQFINELNTAGFTGNEKTQADAIAYATKRLSNKYYVSLGGFGGYIIVGFDHSIPKTSNTYDFSIQGNAFNGSSEPGIIWVMQDINKNGLPDDEWYELKGCETGKESTTQNYAVTYYRPSGKGMSVQWTDSKGETGKIDYLQEYHAQDYYYPQWIKKDSYTLRGTCLEAHNKLVGNIWKNQSYDWGYADNYGTDVLAGDAVNGSGQQNGFKISNAIYRDGSSVDLKYIDFIKVQVGANTKSGPIGELSTEVFSFYDLSITNQQ
ncbi:PKD-like domain-containing protein [uncultured Bacteroides sp.]|uniref:PKD-like domain-containing protein n=1 Tax=uncultured Bacteroides sp. TaxID=162156 RepID=UPI002AA7AF90|nr:PKD-like domain-containing protein [uncultured Bacteroides sp.]